MEEAKKSVEKPRSSRKTSTRKEAVDYRPPTKGKDLSLLMMHQKKANPGNTQNSSQESNMYEDSHNTYLSPEQSEQSNQNQGRGKNLS